MYACPSCFDFLKVGDHSCRACGFRISTKSTGSVVVEGDFFADHNHEEIVNALSQGQRDYFRLDEFINERFTENFVLPLIRRVFGQRKDIKILSVGCGIGSDVRLLRDCGFSRLTGQTAAADVCIGRSSQCLRSWLNARTDIFHFRQNRSTSSCAIKCWNTSVSLATP